jgi:hypothetical protein
VAGAARAAFDICHWDVAMRGVLTIGRAASVMVVLITIVATSSR